MAGTTGCGVTSPLLRADADGVATLTLNRPERHNALTVPMLELLDAQLAAVDADTDIAALVITGTGASFCSGADTAEFADRPTDPGRARRIDLVTTCLARLRALAIPSIAVVTGAAHGAGWGIALACDVTYASADATFCLPEIRRGYTLPAPIVHRLRAVVGPVRAAFIALGGDRLTASDGRAAGWVAATGTAQEIRRQAHEQATALAKRGRVGLADVLAALRAVEPSVGGNRGDA
jgi:2-(1,2-epoxy-1,2-dihydrophenyl)acetyl-CoA isomerase